MTDNRISAPQSSNHSKVRAVRRPLLALCFLAASTAVPLAFAQTDPAAGAASTPEQPAQPPMDAATQAETPPTTEPPPASEARDGEAMGPATAAATGAQTSGQQGWEDIDLDRDGNISREEATANAGLSEIFDRADADADGSLTPDEYRQFIEQNNNQAPPTP